MIGLYPGIKHAYLPYVRKVFAHFRLQDLYARGAQQHVLRSYAYNIFTHSLRLELLMLANKICAFTLCAQGLGALSTQ